MSGGGDALVCVICGKRREDGFAQLSQTGRGPDGWWLAADWAVCDDHPTADELRGVAGTRDALPGEVGR